MIEIISNICATSFIVSLLSWVINSAFISDDVREISDIHAVVAVATFLLPVVIFIVSLMILVWL